MAKAAFHRNQRVWVESVGAWAVIERIVPLWAQGFDEPVRISYDVGLGRYFQAQELRTQPEVDLSEADIGPRWRLLRMHNKWQTPEACRHHPFPGSFPVVVTDAIDWGGWRTPGAEYDRDPHKIEFQARLIASAPHLLSIARSIAALSASTARPSAELKRLAGESAKVEQFLKDSPVPPEGTGHGEYLAEAGLDAPTASRQNLGDPDGIGRHPGEDPVVCTSVDPANHAEDNLSVAPASEGFVTGSTAQGLHVEMSHQGTTAVAQACAEGTLGTEIAGV